jgi:hypothetical protein
MRVPTGVYGPRTPHRQTFLAILSLRFLAVDDYAITAQQDIQSAALMR